MHPSLVPYLACPSCGGDVELDATETDPASGRVRSGTLGCAACGARYAIVREVPRLNVEMAELERVAETFSFEWKAHHEGELEGDTVFGLTREQDWAYFLEATGVDGGDLAGARVLDAGCGSGSLTRQMGEHGAELVIGMDINEAVDEAQAACRALENVQIVQGNIFAPPFKKELFDLVWSNGVIHHTPDAEGAHRSLAGLVRPGGVLYVWVYARRFNPFRFTKDVLDALRVTRLPPRALLAISTGFSYASLALLRVYQLLRKLPGLRPRTAHARRTVRDRTLQELRLTWLDALSPEYDSRHSEQEVVGWFEGLGFTGIRAIEEPKVGVRGVRPD
jgi:2-polyprenyl-3-methyl-5-hydroxy-6-metoxy-1,4-benzoquinol methylase